MFCFVILTSSCSLIPSKKETKQQQQQQQQQTTISNKQQQATKNKSRTEVQTRTHVVPLISLNYKVLPLVQTDSRCPMWTAVANTMLLPVHGAISAVVVQTPRRKVGVRLAVPPNFPRRQPPSDLTSLTFFIELHQAVMFVSGCDTRALLNPARFV